MDSFNKAGFLRAARFGHTAAAFSAVHWGPQTGSTWRGTVDAGELCFDNGCGDVLVAAWDARGLVGLALDHELESPALSFAEHSSQGFFAEIPGALRELIHQAS